ncbi:MAG: cytochrome c55X [Betaproteobacteria bacterium]|jgi:mono/diheme cytochrome c family protein|nr:cytochrome c55X [Betaproteobacteria bacterium]
MPSVKYFGALLFAGAVAHNACAQQFPPEQVKRGAAIYSANCVTCHGENMKNPPWAIDLATFPRDERARFIDSVTNGVRNMPPWGDVIKPDGIEALWAYLVAGEK